MKRKHTILGIVLLAVIAYIFYLGVRGNRSNMNNVSNDSFPSAVQPSGRNSSGASGIKFADQPYANKAYLISGDTLDSDAKQAISGFNLDKQTLSDGSQKITLTAVDPGYQDQQYTITSGEKLYFVEKFMGDDPNNHENNIGDDQAIVVNSDGYVVQAPDNLQ